MNGASLSYDKVRNSMPRVQFSPGRAGGPALEAVFRSNVRNVSSASVLKFEGDKHSAIFCVLDGWLSLSKSLEDGQTQIIDFALPGDFVDVAGADGATCSVTVKAVTGSTIAVVPVAVWKKLMKDSPEAQGIDAKMAAAARARISERMLRLGKGSAEKRVAYALLELCTRIYASDPAVTDSFHIPLRQQQLGDFVGLSSVHVCRTLRRLVRQNIISMRDHMNINIIDVALLSSLADVDLGTLSQKIVPPHQWSRRHLTPSQSG
jgi:CRP-like cAMP-binding protein